MRKQEVDYIITRMLDAYGNVSDLNVTVGKPFQVETAGQLVPVEMEPPFRELTPFQTEIFALNLINRNRRLTENLIREGSCDLSYILPGKARFRVNVFSQRGMYSSVLRKLETKIPTIEDLKLPDAFGKIARERNGIVFVTGATGSGKTTSLAAVLNAVNETRNVHVITLEDPVEYSHPHKKCTFNQRELGKDFDTFAHGLRAALRQAPKIILVGEMRDRETVEIGLSAAETGHLVLSTLHTVTAGQSIERLLGFFNIEEEKQIRMRLSSTIRWIVCQRLLPRVGGGRVAAFDIIGNNLRVQESILHGESEGKTFYEIQEAGRAFGMTTFDEYIIELFRKGAVTEETALSYCSRRAVVGRGIDSIKSRRGESTTDITGLELEGRV
ncbi:MULTISPECIES: type IV pilus twitching motility protein PilT [Desulfococcus]|jgi:twitching motility protein PilT|uniref:Twitching motility protein n=1 Tax=Desulfococcus multivorans DSM 2059 TaxID=1121405 RepID=S7UUM3_DESML|nr:PilT/PilU family type 4a pilus ATPase [Desulfococcus multivorans]AOY60076.1 PilT2: twitching mobility protein [Desulfococcus multivorans]AQV02214.1 twitching motility protein [Desulfococcus multivorans]EPR36068.1 twitching motility protein [Desulfococcus multivorans DSM 2059]SJZ37892.1 twitching motility protein PilT [Desulfococcus multivorans DSM 2059]